MDEVYKRIVSLCDKKNIDITTMCKEAGVSRAILSEFKMGRTKKLSTNTLAKLSDYFHVTVDYLLSGEHPSQKEKIHITDADLKVAFWGNPDVSDKQLEKLRKFAKFIEDED